VHDGPPGSIDDLARHLRCVVSVGAHRAHQCDPDALPPLLALGCVQRRAASAYPDSGDGRALALRDVIADALDALGDGPHGDAARLLFGTATGTRGRPLKDRRRLAADVLDLQPGTFRRNYEPGLVHDVATEIYRAEHNRDDTPPTHAVR
jgi:hypothetical protein